MKYKHRALALILSIAMMLTFMPAMAFAEDAAEDAEQPVAAEEVAAEEAASAEEAVPAEEAASAEEAVPAEEAASAEEAAPAEEAAEGVDEESLEPAEDMEAAAVYPKAISYSGAQLKGYIGEWGAFNLYEAGNSITITYSDNSKKTFKYVDWDPDADIDEGFYLNGNNEAERLEGVDLYVDSDEIIESGNNKGYVVLGYGENDPIRFNVTIVGVASDEISSVTFTQKKAITVAYVDRWAWDEAENFEGDILTVNYKDDRGTRKYVSTKYYDEDDEEYYYRFECTVSDGEDTWKDVIWPSYMTDKEVGDWLPGSTHTVSLYVDGFQATGSIKVTVEKVAKPTKVEIVQTAPAQALIGQNYVYAEELYSAGNKIVVTYDDNTVQEYVYQRYENDESDYAFYYIDEDGDYRSFWEEIALDSRVKKGESTVSGKVTVPWDGPTEVRLPVTVKVSAAQYLAQVTYKTYQYTGKKITPKVTVKYWTGKKFKTMSKKWYTCKPKKNKKIGGYTFQVKIKKKYQSKYGKVLYGGYEIIPKKPTISKAKAGTGSIKVSWKKFSSKDQKTINGFVVQYSTSKKFPYQDTEWYWVDNKKASSCTITELEKGKKYYVRVCSYTEIGKGDGSSLYLSNPSKSKNATVK